ncbi:MAG TPA: DCC1-like thiol-disulfide oxidoreductase family protein [Blastocatellia bacterium]|nr:DCC1-like thiol-disulfide oxidoreductase family protein [Blastocatellia bacterium]
MQEPSKNYPVLLYDGECGFCNKSVQMILNHDERGRMRFAALESDYGKAIKSRHPELEGIDSVVFVEHQAGREGERVFVRSEAALRVTSYLGGWWKLFLVFRLMPRPVRDYFYDLFAKYRYKLFGKRDACMLPPPEARSRFLDAA